MKKLLIILCLFTVSSSIVVSSNLNQSLNLTVTEYSSEEEMLEFVAEYKRLQEFEDTYESNVQNTIKAMEKYVHVDKDVKVNIGISEAADAALIATSRGKLESVKELIVFYPKASLVKEHVVKINKTTTDKIFLTNLVYDGNDELEELHYGNRSYVKVIEYLDELVDKGELKKTGENEYENSDGVIIIALYTENEYPPVRGLYTHLRPEYKDALYALLRESLIPTQIVF